MTIKTEIVVVSNTLIMLILINSQLTTVFIDKIPATQAVNIK
mgnify:FL=1